MLWTGLLTEDIPGTSRKPIAIGSRVKIQILRFYGMPYLTVLNRGHPLAKMYMTGHLMWVTVKLQHSAQFQTGRLDY
jgi:hypothetical protein